MLLLFFSVERSENGAVRQAVDSWRQALHTSGARALPLMTLLKVNVDPVKTIM